MIDIILKNFEKPDETRNFTKGKFELVDLGKMTIGKATYEPGWKWSEDVSPLSGTKFCEVEHLGIVISGSATVAFENEKTHILKKGDLFYVPPVPHEDRKSTRLNSSHALISYAVFCLKKKKKKKNKYN